MTPRFSLVPSTGSARFDVIYRIEDYSFDASPRPQGGLTSLAINEIQIDVARDGRLLYAWGYCPYLGWKETTATPEATGEYVITLADEELEQGVSIKLNPDKRWPAYVNYRTGWVGILESTERLDRPGALFAAGSMALLDDARLVGLWLHPRSVPVPMP